MLKLRELRKRTGITMKDLGEAVGLAESTMRQENANQIMKLF